MELIKYFRKEPLILIVNSSSGYPQYTQLESLLEIIQQRGQCSIFSPLTKLKISIKVKVGISCVNYSRAYAQRNVRGGEKRSGGDCVTNSHY